MSESVRLDKWLWASRFFKTRGVSKEAIDGGKVHLNGARVKASRAVSVGDMLQITRGFERFEVEVLGLSEKRLGAPLARNLYAETEESVTRREHEALQRKAARLAQPNTQGRPDKHTRKELLKIKRKD